MKLSDYVIEYLYQQGVDTVFTLSGGGIMHLIDSLGRRKGEVDYVCNYHEQACAIAAESYARTRRALGVCLVTTGPGSTNALSAIAGAWVDSIPVLVISGQVRTDLIADYTKERQLGPQEINIIDMVKPVTKYAVTVTDPATIKDELDKAVQLALSGRPGPVWINLPLNIQAVQVDLASPSRILPLRQPIHEAEVSHVLASLSQYKRPVLILGNGVQLANAQESVLSLVEKLGIPTLLTWGGLDLLADTHPLFMGRFGPLGQRHANFIIQNSDFMLCIGASMSVSNIGFNTEAFAPNAYKVVINTDSSEIDKMQPVPDKKITADAGLFIHSLLEKLLPNQIDCQDWLIACHEWRQKYPTITAERWQDKEHVDSYIFIDKLSGHLSAHDVLLTGNGLDAWSVYQCLKIKMGQRVYTNINFGAMGWDLPACVGALAARKGERTILVTGDGSIQLNIQELLTLGTYQGNCVVFVLNNGGYESIRATQNNHFAGHLVAADRASGVANPDFQHLAKAYGLQYCAIADNEEIDSKLTEAFQLSGAVLCEVNLSYFQSRTPRVMSYKNQDGTLASPALENMYPFLPEAELADVMNRFKSS
ncbi:thiamine pyrophosphate-binding protein [Neisseriaceae bacterium TC5R-5]|nr:thiamine pyrophosphate-binding protein [Neisseriaceae bacterium TC5R-5]